MDFLRMDTNPPRPAIAFFIYASITSYGVCAAHHHVSAFRFFHPRKRTTGIDVTPCGTSTRWSKSFESFVGFFFLVHSNLGLALLVSSAALPA